MARLAPIEGRKLIKILCNEFGFRAIRQNGSHVTLTNGKIYVTVPTKEILWAFWVLSWEIAVSRG